MNDGSPSSLLDPAVLMKVGPLDVVATRVVEGYLAGRHRSPFKGGCVEFAEHRPYSAGDEIRLMDWRAFARRDRYYIKQYQEETNLQAALVLDASGSMGFGQSTVSKFRYAQVACACLARLLLQQGDAVGLATFDTKVRYHLPARSARGHMHAVLDTLEHTTTGGETSLANILHDLARRFRRRGLMIIASDCFEDVDPLMRGLRRLRACGHDLVLLHVMAPEELTFAFDRWSQFECLETGTRLELDPAAVRHQYVERVRAFLEQLRKGCRQVECDYCGLVTDQPLGDALAYCLASRAARMK
jgi:uncharacterized protein (DUF58 family)